MKSNPNFLSLLIYSLVILSFLYSNSLVAQDRNNTLELKAQVRDITPTLTEVMVCWRSTNPVAVAQQALRKPEGQLYWGKSFNSINNNDTCFLDTIPTNTIYDYCVLRDSNTHGVPNFGYISVGNKVQAVLDRGNVLLVLDTTHQTIFDSFYTIFKKDLIGDGWQFEEFRVDSGTSINTIKTGIVSRYNANPTRIKHVILIGNIMVPYSGDFNGTTLPSPDGHTPDHDGAWPADVYYGDIQSGSWSDASVVNTTGTRTENHNIVGDGKFDQSILPGLVELSVGRIDLSDLPTFSSNEASLMINYFTKNNNYRHGRYPTLDEAVLDYNFGTLLGPSDFGAQQCYRAMAPFYGYNAVNNLDYFTTLQTNYYKWAFGYGFGNYSSISGVGNTSNFGTSGRLVRSIFNVFYGSYFVDWDNSNNFLRGALGPFGSTLTSVGGGRPIVFFQSMGMGKSIGYSVLESQNNYDIAFNTSLFPYVGYGHRFTTLALMGDPTLRLDYINPVRNITFCKDSLNSDTMRIFWQAPLNENQIDTYYVFRGDYALDSFSYQGKTTDTSFNDTVTDMSRPYYYMVRASRLDSNCSGNYYNLSQGVCAVTEYLDKETFMDSVTICNGDSVWIGRNIGAEEASQNYAYYWTPATNLNRQDSARVLAFPTVDTDYYLETRDKFGFTSYDTIRVKIAPLPSNGISVVSQSASCGDTVTLISNPSPSGTFAYDWAFNNGNPNSISGTNMNGPHVIIFDSAGTQKVNLDILYNGGSCLYKDSIGVSISCVVLPVELLDFTATSKNDNVLLEWETAMEVNNHFFEVHRSFDGTNFSKVHTIFSKSLNGNSLSNLRYDVLDTLVPSVQDVFYKLIQQDLNGVRDSFPIVSIRLKRSQVVYPIPFNENLLITKKGIQKAEFYSMDGKIVKSINNPDTEIDTRFLKNGFYYLKLFKEDKIETIKVYKE